MKLFSFLLLFLSIFTIAATTNPDLAARKAVEQIVVFQQGEKQALQEAEALLNEALLVHPEHHGLLKARIDVSLLSGAWQRALEDLDHLIAAGGGFPEITLYRCLILEHLGAEEKEFSACYEQICNDYAARKKQYLGDDLNWALAALLAGQKEKAEELIARSKANPELMADEIWNALLPGGVFNRHDLVETLLSRKTTETKD